MNLQTGHRQRVGSGGGGGATGATGATGFAGCEEVTGFFTAAELEVDLADEGTALVS